MLWKNIVRREYVWWLAMIFLASAGILIMRYMTPNGMGLVNDSVEYIGGARNFLAGKGYSRIGGDGNPIPITHFPPMFSSVLISVSFFGLDVIRAAHLVNLCFFAANIFLTGLLVRRLTASKLFSLLAAILFLISEPILRVHSFILSEPLFLFLVYCIFWFLVNQLEDRKWYWVVLLGIFTSMAFLDRYIGGSLYALVGLLFLIFSPSWKTKFQDIALFLAVGIPAPAVWMVRNMIVSGNPTNRPIAYHPVTIDRWYDGVRNFWTWLLPENHALLEPHLHFFGLALIVIVGVFTAWGTLWVIEAKQGQWKHVSDQASKKTRFIGAHFDRPGMYVAIVSAIYAVLYFVLLLIAMTFFDEATTYEHRMLLPFYTSALILLFGFFAFLWRHPVVLVKVMLVVMCSGLFISVAEDSIDTIRELHGGGQGFASGRWRNSATMEAVRHLPSDIKIFTNKRTAIYLLADKGSYVIPWRFYPDNPEPHPSYVQGVEDYRNQVLDNQAVVVIFDYQQEIRDENEAVIDMTQGLPILGMYDDGAIFGDVP